MKRKVGTLIEQDLLGRAKRRAADEGRPLSDLLHQALEGYLATAVQEPGRAEAAYRAFCESPIGLTRAQLRAVLEQDAWSG